MKEIKAQFSRDISVCDIELQRQVEPLKAQVLKLQATKEELTSANSELRQLLQAAVKSDNSKD